MVLNVRAAITALPAKEREIVEFVHWEGPRIMDGAVAMGIDASTARSRYAKARAALAATLASATPLHPGGT